MIRNRLGKLAEVDGVVDGVVDGIVDGAVDFIRTSDARVLFD
jgi:hypothetical protein